MARSILIIEDEKEIADLIALHLDDAGYTTTHTVDGVRGLTLALSQSWDLILLDLNLPRLDGLEICQQVRHCNPDTPIILVTARTTEQERILGLDAGADDYIIKPFSVLELVARIRAIFRRLDITNRPTLPETLAAGDIVLDKRTHEVTVSGRVLTLTPKEFELLVLFVESPGRVFKRHEILEKVWGYPHEGYLHTVNSHINRLRAKIEDDPPNPAYIKTVWGVGYKLSSCST